MSDEFFLPQEGLYACTEGSCSVPPQTPIYGQELLLIIAGLEV